MRTIFVLALFVATTFALASPRIDQDKAFYAVSTDQTDDSGSALSLYHTPDNVDPETSLSLADSGPSPAGIGKAALLLCLKNRLIYFVAARITPIIVKAVVSQLEKHNVIGKQDKATIDFITGALEKITIIILTMALIASKPGGTQIVELGADAGGKIKRSALLLDGPLHATSWDMADDETHAAANTLNGRAVVSKELRQDMLYSGVSNVTVVHNPYRSMDNPILSYRGADDKLHFHWRATAGPEPNSKPKPKGDSLYTHHYPFFDAGGAGFKISAHTPIGSHIIAVPEDDAARIAKVIVQDYLKTRVLTSEAGYEEKYKDSGLLGHRLCYIAEDRKFGLKDEFDKCFGKGK